MNLIQQFPDISMQMRQQALANPRNVPKEKNTKQADDTRLIQYYDNEFRKWHLKLVFIIVFIITCLYSAVFTISALFNQ